LVCRSTKHPCQTKPLNQHEQQYAASCTIIYQDSLHFVCQRFLNIRLLSIHVLYGQKIFLQIEVNVIQPSNYNATPEHVVPLENGSLALVFLPPKITVVQYFS
jgi:hypothetical protein